MSTYPAFRRSLPWLFALVVTTALAACTSTRTMDPPPSVTASVPITISAADSAEVDTTGADAAESDDDRPSLTLDDLFDSPRFQPRAFQEGRWAEEGPVVTYIETDPSTGVTHLMSYNLNTQARNRLIDGGTLRAPDVDRLIQIEGYAYSPDRSKVLIYTDSEQVWRLNTKGYYYIYTLDDQTLTPLSDRGRGLQMFAKFSPDGQAAGFVRDRNLFTADLRTMTETQWTDDGAPGTVINGTFDWVYEEEFGLRDGWAWSPDGRFLGFFQLDETATRNFVMADLRNQYPELVEFRYPKAGEANSEVRVGVVDREAKAIRFFDTGTWNAGGDSLEYLAQMGWTPPVNGRHYLWVFRLNRDQNRLDLLYADPETGSVHTILEEAEPTWIDVHDAKLTYLDDGRHFIWESEVDGYRHLYLYTNEGEFVRRITEGDWEVTAFHGVDEAYAYFTATHESPLERHLYRAPLDGSGADRPEKITRRSGWHTVTLSRDREYYIDRYSDVLTPTQVSLHAISGERLQRLEENAELAALLDDYALPEPEFFTVPAADGTPLNAYLIKPTDFDSTRAYPLLIHTYGGPGSQEVGREWEGTERLWHTYLAEEHGILVAGVDNRGTEGRGKGFKSATYKNLGDLEAQDQIAAAQAMGEWPYVDADRIGIWGWSYGGYLTLMSMLTGEGPETFILGMAVAPVTDWRQYDTIYTERYMSTPQRNAAGYQSGSPITYADRLRADQDLLIVHGDFDDNVHFQNTVQMIDALQAAGKQFSLMVYPGRNHAIYGGTTRLHLYTLMTDYILDHL